MAFTRDDFVRMLYEEDDLINSIDDDLEMDGDEEECEDPEYQDTQQQQGNIIISTAQYYC